MSENGFNGEELTGNLNGMSADQLYRVMCQMKTLIDQNAEQAREILIQNPQLTQALFRAQIMLGMVRPNQPTPNNPQAAIQIPQQATLPVRQAHVQATSPLSGQTDLQDQTKASQTQSSLRKPNQPVMPVSSASVPPSNSQSQPLPSHASQSTQQPRGHFNAPVPQSSQIQNMVLPSLHSASPQPAMPSPLTQSQQPFPTSGISHVQLQPTMPSQTRPVSTPAFGHQFNTQMRPNAGFQHSSAVQMHQLQPVFNSGQNHQANMGRSISQGIQPLPSQPQHQSPYQGGSPHFGMEFSQVGGPMQAERGSYIPGLGDNTTGTQNIPGPLSFMAGQMGPASQLLLPPSLAPGVESALLQQVMSLTPEQISFLPPDQRNQVLQLQQMVRQGQ